MLFRSQMLLKGQRNGVLTLEETEDLLEAVETELYVRQVKDFRKHIVDSLPKGDLEPFYDETWTISFKGKSVTIGNEATIYHAMLDAMNDYIDDCL